MLGDEHPDTLKSIVNMGRLFRSMERLDEAETLLLQAAAGAEKLPPRHSLRARVAESLIKLYDAWHAAEPDKGYDARSDQWRGKLSAVDVTMQEGKPPDDRAPVR